MSSWVEDEVENPQVSAERMQSGDTARSDIVGKSVVAKVQS